MKWKHGMIAAGCLLIAAGGWRAYDWWQSPAESFQTTSTGKTEVLGSDTATTAWQTEYFSTQHKSNLRLITSNEAGQGNVLAQYLLGSASIRQTDQLAVTVGRLPDGQLTELSSVKMRQMQPDVYTQTERSYAPAGALVFEKTDGYEVAVFWVQGDRYGAAVVSGVQARQAELEDSLQTVLASWQWR